MGTPPLLKIETSSLRGEANREAGGITCSLQGTADLTSTEELTALVSALHDAAIEAGVDRVTMDLRAVEFMSSSCFQCLVDWVLMAQRAAERDRYAIRLLHDPEVLWQRRGTRSLAGFSEGLVDLVPPLVEAPAR